MSDLYDIPILSPRDFNYDLLKIEDKFIDGDTEKPKIPVILTLDTDRTVPLAIRKQLDSTNSIEGFIVRSPTLPRQGRKISEYLAESDNHGTWIYFVFGSKKFTLPIDSITNVQVKKSEYLTTDYKLGDDSPYREESASGEFFKFLDSLIRTEDDKSLIESAKKGYVTCINKNKES